MKKHSDETSDWQGQRNKIIGLGESSIRKSYYPELQQKMAELEKKNEALNAAYEELTSSEEELRQNYEELSAREHELRESEEKYRNLIENTFDGVILHRDQKIVYANRTAARLFGSTGSEELIGLSILDVVHPDYLAIIREHATQALETTQLPRHEKFLHRDGTEYDVEVVATPTTWEGLPAVQVAFRDLTNQKRAEEALKESEIFYRTLFETTGAASIIINEDATVSRANEGYARITGYSREEIEGKRNWREFVVQEDLERMNRYHSERRTNPSQVPEVYEFGFRDRNGNIRRCIVSVSMIPGTTKSVASFVDITDRVTAQQELERRNRELHTAYEEQTVSEEELKQNYEELSKTERDLRSAKAFLQAIYEGSPDMIMVHSKEGRIVDMNENAVKGYGYSLEEMAGLRPETASGRGCTSEMAMARIQQAFEQGATDFAWVGRRRNGEEFPVEVRLRRIESETEAGVREQRVLAIVRDITERHMAENALEQARKKLGLLNTVIFQDIQSTIFALSAYMQLANSERESSKAKSYAEKEEFLVHKIISLLNFAKNYQELGVQPSRWQNVNRVFLYAISHLDSLKIARKIQLNGLEIYADPLLEKVFFNLIENIFLHGQKVTELTFTFREEAPGLLLIFQDNGVGIPVDEKKKIFERGYGKNTGLGLFLVREILSITGMSIQETGIAGEGARFEILVPKGAYRFSTIT
jgi:PAS domain S-box-containing protein